MFLDEMEDDKKFNEFLNEAARIYFFDFDNFKVIDAEDAAYSGEMKRKQDRIYHEMRNFSWKGDSKFRKDIYCFDISSSKIY